MKKLVLLCSMLLSVCNAQAHQYIDNTKDVLSSWKESAYRTRMVDEVSRVDEWEFSKENMLITLQVSECAKTRCEPIPAKAYNESPSSSLGDVVHAIELSPKDEKGVYSVSYDSHGLIMHMYSVKHENSLVSVYLVMNKKHDIETSTLATIEFMKLMNNLY